MHLIIWQLRKVLIFTRKTPHLLLNRQLTVTHLKKPPRVSVHQPLWYLLTICLLLHQLNQTLQLSTLQKTQRRTLTAQNQQMKEISKWNTPSKTSSSIY